MCRLGVCGSSRNHTQSNRQIVASVKRGDDSRSEDTALTHHRLRVSWDNIESGKVRGPTDRRGLGFSGPPGIKAVSHPRFSPSSFCN
eukprot:scaffold10577_cov233-Isochrysis_galbana.AAC.1